MYPSSVLCRAQEAHHLGRAATASLDNVRVIATRAALAWGQEALCAELREARHSRTRRIASLRTRQSRADHDRLLSENPDRGFESP